MSGTSIESGSAYPSKLFVAAGMFRSFTILAVDGEAANYEIQSSLSAEIDDWNIDPPDGVGLWVWEGEIFYPPWDDDGCEPDCDGEWRRATADEATRFAAGLDVWPAS